MTSCPLCGESFPQEKIEAHASSCQGLETPSVAVKASPTKGTGKLVVRFANILTAKEDYIAHQCNCVSKTAKGLSAVLFKKFPEANVYCGRTENSIPGTIVVRRRVVNMFAQYGPGKPKAGDKAKQRELWFEACLEAFVKHCRDSGVEGCSVAMPWQIGCGLAGGSWDRYQAMLSSFARRYPEFQVVLYKLES